MGEHCEKTWTVREQIRGDHLFCSAESSSAFRISACMQHEQKSQFRVVWPCGYAAEHRHMGGEIESDEYNTLRKIFVGGCGLGLGSCVVTCKFLYCLHFMTST